MIRRAVRVALVGLITLGALEATARLVFRAVRGPGAMGGLQTERARSAGPDGAADAALAQGITRDAVPHPYLGTVQLPGRADEAFVAYHSLPVDALGFIDDGDPLPRRSPDKLIIGITGGSVAFFFSVQGVAALERELRTLPELADKRFEIRRLALGGWKQPQQLFAVQYVLALGGELDLLINLDGYNEVALYGSEIEPTGQPPIFPRGWAELVGNDFSVQRHKALGRLVGAADARAGWARITSVPPLDRSALVGVVWLVGDRALGRRSEEALRAFRAAAAGETVAAGPKPTFSDAGARGAALADLWARSSRLLAAVSAGEHIRYFHFLQPNQYVTGAKPMSEAERRVAIDGSPAGHDAATGYPLLIARGAELRAAGIEFTDLTGLFKDVPEPIYVDTCCHLNAAGNERLGRAIGQAIVAAWRSGERVAETDGAPPRGTDGGAPATVSPGSAPDTRAR